MSADRWNGIGEPDDLVEHVDDTDAGDAARDSLEDLDVEHVYPLTYSEGCLSRRQAQ